VDYGDRRLRRHQRKTLRWVGGNLAIRRDVIDRVGWWDVRMVRGQDTDYYRRCVRQGLAVVYEPTAVAYHKLGSDRMTLEYFKRWRHRVGYYHMYLVPWRKLHMLSVMPMWWYGQTFGYLIAWVRKWLTRRPWVERFGDELRLREAWSVWRHRLQLWPRWCVAVIIGRPFVP